MSHRSEGLFGKRKAFLLDKEGGVSKLKNIAKQFQDIKLSQLMQLRAIHGFNHFIFDLKDSRHNSQNEGWFLTNGMLHVEHSQFQNDIIKAQVHALLNETLSDRPWYQIHSDGPSINTQYGIAIKTLGKNGINSAVDPILLLQDRDGKVSVLSGQRPVCNEYCLPGGMNESTVINTCVSELLEECFSGDLFEPNAASSIELNSNVSNITKLNAFIKNLCPAELRDGFTALTTTDVLASKAIQNAIEHIQRSPLDAGKKAPLIAKIKCELYRNYLISQYNKFSDFIDQHIDQTQKNVVNGSDPRNTDAAYMETKPLPGFLDKDTFIDYVTHECALNFGAGDDLGNVKLRDIDVFCGEITSTGTASSSPKQGTYSDHASLVLSAIALGLESDRLTLTDALSHQIKTIIENHPELDLNPDEQPEIRPAL